MATVCQAVEGAAPMLLDDLAAQGSDVIPLTPPETAVVNEQEEETPSSSEGAETSTADQSKIVATKEGVERAPSEDRTQITGAEEPEEPSQEEVSHSAGAVAVDDDRNNAPAKSGAGGHEGKSKKKGKRGKKGRS